MPIFLCFWKHAVLSGGDNNFSSVKHLVKLIMFFSNLSVEDLQFSLPLMVIVCEIGKFVAEFRS